MNIPDEAPKLNPWPFIVVDALLLGIAAAIGAQTPAPISGTPLLVVGALIFLGAIIAITPFLLTFSRRQEVALAERQNEIAALAQTTAASAEQLSIAAASLHSIAETAAKSVKQVEQLPQKMQEKIHEFKEQLNEVSLNENEVLSQEVNTLRAAETERIETILTTVRKLSSEIARLEAASRKNVTELTESLTRFTASAEQAAAEATTAVASMRAGAEKSLANAHASAMSAIEETLSHALAEIDSKFSTLSGHLNAKIDHASDVFDAKIAKLERAVDHLVAAPAMREGEANSVAPVEPRVLRVDASGPGTETSARAASAPPEPTAMPESTAAGGSSPEAPKPPRKRMMKRVISEEEMTLGLDLPAAPDQDGATAVAAEEAPVATASSDGLTRLLVTAYIGIGNKLFIRGEGPGLSWEKGVPLQFVSIGKWRWETADAQAPVTAKLYKNDETECTSLGDLSIDPGQQREVTATFNS